VILIAVLLRTIDAFKVFDVIWIMTSGGPGTATTTLNILGYETAFEAYNMGKASALGIILLYMSLALTMIFIRVIGRKKK
jgi:multiple sugar transport system permease protein